MGINKFFRRTLLPSIQGTTKWRGTTNILSGGSTVTVSVAGMAVTSLAPPQLSLGTTTVASHRAMILSCNSIVTNTSFCIVSDKAASGGDQQVVYTIVN